MWLYGVSIRDRHIIPFALPILLYDSILINLFIILHLLTCHIPIMQQLCSVYLVLVEGAVTVYNQWTGLDCIHAALVKCWVCVSHSTTTATWQSVQTTVTAPSKLNQ